ncbi:MAG TPA: NAD-dependent epimerase/dehydratase family protein [Candidatus Thermoplasmatota archaeon]|nr:NAD-dependent epimerase/dehydratase family protein [Candidatus Thermoplasmatota archaeon]
MRFAGRKVAVTGGTGYLGGAVVRDLVREGAEVTVLARRPEAAAHLAGRPGVRLAKADVARPETLDLAGHDTVVHAAAWVAFGIPKRKRERFWKTNVDGTRHVVEAARKAGVARFVHVSSIAALGDTRGTVADESFVPGEGHRSFYEVTKRAAHAVALAADSPELAVSAVMPAVIVGLPAPWQDGGRASVRGPMDGLLDRFAAGRWLPTPSGDGPTSFVHVDDVAEGVLLAALRGGGPYLLTDTDCTFHEFFARLGRAIGRPEPRARVPLPVLRAALWTMERTYHALGKVPPASTELAASLAADMRYDSSKARKDLGWEPDLWGKLRRDYLLLAQA